MKEQVENAPIVDETVRRKVIEEVQPVLYKETIRPLIIRAKKPIYEHIVESPVLTEETRPMVDLGTKVVGEGVCNPCLPSATKMIIKEKTTVLEPERGREQMSYKPSI